MLVSIPDPTLCEGKGSDDYGICCILGKGH